MIHLKIKLRLKEEAFILRNLAHKNIVGFRGFVEQGNGMCVLAMEDGEKSLLSMIEERCEKGLGRCALKLFKLTFQFSIVKFKIKYIFF